MSAKLIVDANYRFIAASQEANARITQRQQSLTLFVTIVLSLIAAIVALRGAGSNSAPALAWLLLGFPLASACLAFLNFKSEVAITNLRRFLSELEQLDNAHLILPSYNTDPRWALVANRARRFHDFASAALVAGAHAIGIGIVHQSSIGSEPTTEALLVVTAILGLAISVFLVAISRWSYLPPQRPNTSTQ